MRFHAGVVPPKPSGWRQRPVGPHLRQGDLDGACGPYCLYMALVVLGVATPAHVRSLRVLSDTKLEDAWIRSLDTFFLGSDDGDLLNLLSTVDRWVRHDARSGSMRQVLRFVLERLDSSCVVLLGLHADGYAGGHWVLAVGVAERLSEAGAATPGAVLCLDPAGPALAVAPFNARLDLDSPRRGSRFLTYTAADGTRRSLTCKSAIALSARR